MLRAVLFDLDDTLLGNSMGAFLPAYFHALTCHFDGLVSAERLMKELMRATKAMNANNGQGRTNEEAFVSTFYTALEPERSQLDGAFEQFYVEEFPKLRHLTQRRPEARSLVSSALKHGLQVAVATNPLFPRIAVEERLAWAGVPVDEFEYALVTTYETMHATKSSPSYYREILQYLGVRAEEALMVGNDWDMDINPALAVGLDAYWITRQEEVPVWPQALIGCGTLAELWALVDEQGWAFGPS